jgi:hypothetical protein
MALAVTGEETVNIDSRAKGGPKSNTQKRTVELAHLLVPCSYIQFGLVTVPAMYIFGSPPPNRRSPNVLKIAVLILL